MHLEEQAAIVTGGAGGLGWGAARALLEAGARVAVVDLSAEALDARRAELGTGPESGRVRWVHADLTRRTDVERAVRTCTEEWGRVDILINCAGGSYDTPLELESITDEHWRRVLDGNLLSAFLMCQACALFMKERRYGRIVNIASIAGRIGGAVTGVHYAAAKGGVIGLTKHLAQELGSHGITVNATAPGLSLSGPRLQGLWERMSEERKARALGAVPLGRPSTVEEQVAAILFLTSPEASFVNGAVLDVNGGRYSA